MRRLRAKDCDVDAGRDDRDQVLVDAPSSPRDSRIAGGKRVGLSALEPLGLADLLCSVCGKCPFGWLRCWRVSGTPVT